MKKYRILVIAIILFSLAAALLPAAEAETEKPKKPFLPFVLNTVPGFGLGSFILGDPLGGFIALGGEVVGAGVFGYGLAYMVAAGLAEGIGTVLTLGLADPEVDTTRGEVCILSGLTLWAGTRLFSMIRPFVFAARENREAGYAEAVPGAGLRLVAADDGYIPVPVLYLQVSR